MKLPPVDKWIHKARRRRVSMVMRGQAHDDRRVSCEGKVRYGPDSAEAAAKRMTAKTGDEFEAYKCRYCDRWHVGHKPGGLVTIRIYREDDPS